MVKTPRSLPFVLLITIAASLLALGSLANTAGPQALAQEMAPMDSQPVTDKELVRNGGFDQYDWYNKPAAWIVAGTGSGVDATAGQDGGPAMSMEAIAETQASIYQELFLPTQTTAATLTFDYRMLPTYGGAAQFYAFLSTPTSTLVTVLETTVVSYDTGWQRLDVALSGDDVAQIQAAHAAGEHVYLALALVQNPANAFKAYVDNVSFRVSGSMTRPAWSGSIAYIGLDDAGNAMTVNRIDPDGRNQQTLWTHPSSVPDTNAIYDVAWKPDASELAFSSNHEFLYSAFHSDVYGIKPDGSGLRRITNPPSKAKLDAGGYQTGTVTGRIYNDYGTVLLFYVYIQGAQGVVSVEIGGHGSEVSFRLENVADLGPGVSQYIVFNWSDTPSDCANGKEYAVIPVSDVIAGQEVDVGTLTFQGNCGDYDSKGISWKRDGSEVGVDVIAPMRFQATGEAFGTELFSAPLTANKLAWSPVDDRILYHNWIVGGDSGIYLTTAGGGAGTWLVNDGGAVWVTPAWLPDGSGFIYTLDNEIHQYDIATGQDTTLADFQNEIVFNPSLSPDGDYIVFDWQTNVSPDRRDLWIMDRSNPLEMWQLTDDGKSTNPDWGGEAPAPAPTETPPASATPTSTSTTSPPTSTPTPTPTETLPAGPTPTSTATVEPTSTPELDHHVYLPAVLRD